MTTNLVTPKDQFIYASQFYQKKFTFENAPDDVRISRYLNNFLKLIGNDIVFKGGQVINYVQTPDTVTITIEKGKLIQDITLVPFPDFTLDKRVTNYTGNSIADICIKLKESLDLAGIGAMIDTTSDSVVITNLQTGPVPTPTNMNTGFTIDTIQLGDTYVPQKIRISPISASDMIYDNTSFPYITLTTPVGLFCIYFSFGSETPPDLPEFAPTSLIEVKLNKPALAVVYTDFKYSSVPRSINNVLVDPDPCPLTFKLDLYDTVNKKFINPISPWDNERNRIVITTYDLFTQTELSGVDIEDIFYQNLGGNRYNFFRNIGSTSTVDAAMGDQTGTALYLLEGNIEWNKMIDFNLYLGSIIDGNLNPYIP